MANSTVTVWSTTGNNDGTATASSSGAWSFTTPVLNLGIYGYYATDTTPGGTSAESNALSDQTVDTTSDILLQNGGGTVVDWIMNNGVYQSGNVVGGAAGYNVVGTGDFTGNGVSDVLLQKGGTVVDWIMKDGAYQSGNVLTTGAAGWTVARST